MLQPVMGVLRFLYVILHFLITYLHRLHSASNELIDHLRGVLTSQTSRRWLTANLATTAKFNTNQINDTLLLQSIGSELNRLQKLPTHVACLFVEQDVQMDKIVTVIEWCAAMGIPCISLYDHQGCITSCQDTIKTKLKNISANFTNGHKNKIFTVHKGFVTRQFINPDSINIFLMNPKDGKPLFAQVAKQVVEDYSYSEINQNVLENSMNQLYPNEPELLLQFGSLLSNTTLGYSPWHLRLTQMLRLPNHTRLRIDHIASAMLEYGACQQRYGK